MSRAPAKWVWEPDPAFVERTNAWRFMRELGFDDREQFLEWSRVNPREFWPQLERAMNVAWFEPYTSVFDSSAGIPWTRWFTGGKLNIAANCLHRWAATDREAVIQESEDGSIRRIGFRDLALQVNRLANGLRTAGLRKGDRVALVMPMTPEVVAILYACFQLGLVAVPIFSGFGEGAIAMRLSDSGARMVFTAPQLERRGKRIPLAEKVRAAAARAPSVERVVCDIEELAAGQPPFCEVTALDSEAPCLILYTSGTTGRPKGCVHTHAGALLQTAKEIWLGFDHQPGDRFFWLSDIGWMMGAWTIIGNHHFGGTILLYDGAPDWPDPDRLWQVLEGHRVTTFGVSPTAVRVLMRGSHPERRRFDDLRLLGSTGEPWDDSSWLWFFEHVGKRRCPVINISGGTEIIGCFLFPLPIQPLKPCTLGAPAPGMATEVVDDAGRPVRGRMGYLVCTAPAPSMTRGVWGDPERYLEAYWSRWPDTWNHGDWASVDEDGCWFLHGRADESMNVAGRKVGPAEVEEALMEHPSVSEAAVIGVPDEVKGEAIVAFVVLKDGAPAADFVRHVETILGPAFRPRAVEVVRELPKTQSGKIVRRLIRQRFLREPLGDTSTVANPVALDALPGQS